MEARKVAVRIFDTGSDVVRFISGTDKAHADLEEKLGAFHGKEAGIRFSSATVPSLGMLVPLASEETVSISFSLMIMISDCVKLRYRGRKAARVFV